MINGVTNFESNTAPNPQTVARAGQENPPTPVVPPMPAIPNKSVKKSSFKIILAAIVLLLVLVGGGAAYFLSQSNTELRQQASTGSLSLVTTGDATTPNAPPPGGYNIRCSSLGTQNGNTFAINWDCWGGEHFQWARPDRVDWPGYPAPKPWKIAGWHCPRPNTSDPNNPKTCNYGDPGAVRVFITDKNTLSYAQGRRDGNGGDGSPCDINSPDQTHCIYHNVTSSTISANAYNNCGFFQADIFVPHPSGQLWDFGGSLKYQVLGAFVHDFGNYDNCTRTIPTPTPTVQCPTTPRANCFYEADGSISANLTWSNGTVPAGAKYLIRADHQPGNVAQCTNTTTQQPVGWYCPAGQRNCIPGQVCDDRYVYITGTSTKLTNIQNGDTYNWALQVDPNGCRVEAGSFRCARTVFPTPSPSPTPTSTPIVYSCNSTCTTDAQCRTANSAYICYKPTATTTNRGTDVLGVSTDTNRQIAAAAPGLNTGNVTGTGATPSPTLTSLGNCRLASNPTSVSCQAASPSPSPSPTPTIVPSPTPVVAPMCLNIVLNSPNNPPRIGDTITLTCGAVAGASRYEFRVREPNGNIVVLNGLTTSRTSQSYQIATNGKYAAQCRICVSSGQMTACQEWEPMPGLPTQTPVASPASCTPMPPCVLTQACDIAEPAGGWCPASPAPSASPVAQCVDEKCAQSVLCLIGTAFCSTTPPTVGQCVCPDGAPQSKTDAEKAEEAAATSAETVAE